MGNRARSANLHPAGCYINEYLANTSIVTALIAYRSLGVPNGPLAPSFRLAGARQTKTTPEPSTLRLKYKEVAVITIAVGAMFAGKAGMWRLY